MKKLTVVPLFFGLMILMITGMGKVNAKAPGKDVVKANKLTKKCTSSPYVRVNPNNNRLEAVYELSEGGNKSDIYFSYWDSYLKQWSTPQRVSYSPAADKNPRLAYGSDGKRYCVWWSDEQVPSIYGAVQNTDTEGWGAPVRISPEGQNAKHPNIVIHNHMITIFYDSKGKNASQDPSVDTLQIQEGLPIGTPSDDDDQN